MSIKRMLTTVCRAGIVLVALLGIYIGLMMAGASDVTLSPMLVMVFPGLLAGYGVGYVFGFGAGVISCGIANGAAYGLFLYGWIRLAKALAHNFPNWLNAAAIRLSQGLNR